MAAESSVSVYQEMVVVLHRRLTEVTSVDERLGALISGQQQLQREIRSIPEAVKAIMKPIDDRLGVLMVSGHQQLERDIQALKAIMKPMKAMKAMTATRRPKKAMKAMKAKAMNTTKQPKVKKGMKAMKA